MTDTSVASYEPRVGRYSSVETALEYESEDNVGF